MRMTELSVTKLIYVVAASFTMVTLGGCDRAGVLVSDTLHKIKTVPVDANDHSTGTADDKTLGGKDVALLLDTAKALTVGHDGVLTQSGVTPGGVAKKLEIAVVDPLLMDRPDDGPPLDERVQGAEMDPEAALAAAAKALPDVPIMAETLPERPQPRPIAVADDQEAAPPADDARPKNDDTPPQRVQTDWVKSDLNRSIQVGSFGTMAAAVNALEALKDSHPAATHYSATYQAIKTATGKAMVRLRLGPVHTDAQAKALCDQLDIHDTWCHKAG